MRPYGSVKVLDRVNAFNNGFLGMGLITIFFVCHLVAKRPFMILVLVLESHKSVGLGTWDCPSELRTGDSRLGSGDSNFRIFEFFKFLCIQNFLIFRYMLIKFRNYTGGDRKPW